MLDAALAVTRIAQQLLPQEKFVCGILLRPLDLDRHEEAGRAAQDVVDELLGVGDVILAGDDLDSNPAKCPQDRLHKVRLRIRLAQARRGLLGEKGLDLVERTSDGG